MMNRAVLLSSLALVLTAGACNGSPQQGAHVGSGQPQTAAQSPDDVWVARDDGSKSCEPAAKADGLAAGAEALQKMGISVLESKKADDGMMHAQMCGLPTGKKDAYRIAKKDLKNAEAMGFQLAK